MDSINNNAHSSKADGVKRNLKFSFHESTPLFKSKSRKRKSFMHDLNHQPCKLSEVITKTENGYHSLSNTDISCYDSCLSDTYNSIEYKSSSSQNQSFASNYDLSFDCLVVSSPLDKSIETVKLSSSLEKCSLLDFDTSSKRIKWDCESPNSKRKSNSAPGTPQHPGIL